ncbi:hypothetical protein FB451DRAFT_1177118 [Mycena latifolia]|nr:hypothetical protein FB451DRAFT_1177118 [Mycena latifolia]
MRASITAVLLATLIAPLTLAAPSGEIVFTPGGYRANTNSHEIPVGGSLAHVGGEIHVLTADGTVVHTATAHKAIPRLKVRRAPPLPTEKTYDGWHVYAWSQNTERSPVGSLTSTWVVPPVPATDVGQTLFEFLSLEPEDGAESILKSYGPSLAGGGAFWSVASWRLLHAVSAPHSNFNAQSTNIPGTSLNMSGLPALKWAVPAALEAYNAETPNYPTGSTVCSDIHLELANGVLQLFWTPTTFVEQNASIKVNPQGVTDAQIIITC